MLALAHLAILTSLSINQASLWLNNLQGLNGELGLQRSRVCDWTSSKAATSCFCAAQVPRMMTSCSVSRVRHPPAVLAALQWDCAGWNTLCRRCLVAGMYASQNSVIAGLVMLSMLNIALICQLGVMLSPPPKPVSSVGVQMASSA